MAGKPDFHLCVARPTADPNKPFWVRIGAAWRTKTGNGLHISFDALPLPDKDGRVTATLFPPREPQAQAAAVNEPGAGANTPPF